MVFDVVDELSRLLVSELERLAAHQVDHHGLIILLDLHGVTIVVVADEKFAGPRWRLSARQSSWENLQEVSRRAPGSYNSQQPACRRLPRWLSRHFGGKTMGKRVRVAQTNEIRPGAGKVVEAGGRDVALFNVDGDFYAIDNTSARTSRSRWAKDN